MKNFFNPWLDTSIKDKALSRFYRSRVVDKSPLVARVEHSYLATAMPRQRLQYFFWTVFAVCSILLSRSFYLQIVQGDSFLALANRNRTRVEYLPAARGLIYDHNNQALVANEPNFVATLLPDELPLPTDQSYHSILAGTLAAVAQQLQLDETTLERNFIDHTAKYPTQPLVVADFIPHDQALQFMAKLRTWPGVHIEAQPARRYVLAQPLAHVLGYVGKISPEEFDQAHASTYSLSDTIGKSGLETVYEDILRGKKGERRIEINAQGQAIDTISETAALPGNNLVLGIDTKLQRLLYDELGRAVDQAHTPGGAAVALDPNTGQIRALVSYPSYDSNLFIRGISNDEYTQLINDARKPLFNKAISGEYPSGSTFKLVVSSAALQEGVVTPSTTVMSTGGIQLDKLYRDWKAGGHGRTDIYKALAESVNTYFYLAGGGSYDSATREIHGGLGIDRIADYAQKFGLNQTTGIDLPGEATGFVPSRDWKKSATGEDWHLGDTYIVSIGQGDLLVTPLQVALYTAVVANGGTLYQPTILERITNQAGVTIKTQTPTVIRQGFIDPANLAVVRTGMRNAVLWGSARRMNSLAVTSAGKTGTAQIGGSDKEHAWYTTFLPYDHPNLVLTVLIEEGGEGSDSALSVAQDVLHQYYAD